MNFLYRSNLYLPHHEMIVYLIIYFVFLFYAIYHVFLCKNLILKDGNFDGYDDGWKFLNQKRDNLDYEWERNKLFIIHSLGWSCLHVLVSESIKHLRKDMLPFAHALVGCAFIIGRYDFRIFLMLTIKCITFYYFSMFRRRWIIWCFALFWLVIINIGKIIDSNEMFQTDDNLFGEEIVIVAWFLLKCISFCFDRIDTNDTQFYGLEHLAGYVFYLPTLYIGPTMIFNRYRNMLAMVDAEKVRKFSQRLMEFIRNVSLCVFWILIVDFSLHYIYINNLKYNIEIVQRLDLWSLYGMGYLMGQYFHLKYVVCYGYGIAFAKFDGIDTPNKPKCIGRIHLYSDMWKEFDQGLYEFLFKYIYKTVASKNIVHQLYRSFITFTFIFLWHGTYKFIFLWSLLNYVCLVVEKMFRYILSSTKWCRFADRHMCRENQLRLTAMIGSQIFIPSAMANFYFFTHLEIGNYYFEMTYLRNGIAIYLILTVICTCVFHVSELIKRIEKKRLKTVLKDYEKDNSFL